MNKNLENSKPDIACKPGYSDSAKIVLSELHENLLTTLEGRLKEIETPNILVVGPGEDILPYSKDTNRVKEIVKNGNLVLSDYNPEICKGLPKKIQEMGLSDRFIKYNADFNKNSSNSIYVQENDIRFGTNLPKNSVDAIDMTVSVHHATPYFSDLDSIFKSAYDSLKKGGVLILGEGDVDMKYSEKKINKVRDDYKEVFGKDPTFVDFRLGDVNNPLKLEPNSDGKMNYNEFISIGNDGYVSIVSENNGHKLFDEFAKRNYFSNNPFNILLRVTPNAIKFPLIPMEGKLDEGLSKDFGFEDDYNGLVAPVNAYYDAIEDVLQKNMDAETYEVFKGPLREERENASKGIVEFYTAPTDVLQSLQKTGFVVEDFKYTTKGPFATTVAVKK